MLRWAIRRLMGRHHHHNLRTLIRAHAAEALEKARLNNGFIGFKQRALLFGDFRLCHPSVEVDFSLFSAELNYALGRGYFLIRTKR